MRVGCLVTAACCALVSQTALAQKAAPAEPHAAAGQPALAAGRMLQSWPKIWRAKKKAEAGISDSSKTDAGPQAAPAWTPQEIELAQARCKTLLNGLPVIAVPEAPIREKDECGAPAPMKLLSIGRSPQVAL